MHALVLCTYVSVESAMTDQSSCMRVLTAALLLVRAWLPHVGNCYVLLK